MKHSRSKQGLKIPLIAVLLLLALALIVALVAFQHTPIVVQSDDEPTSQVATVAGPMPQPPSPKAAAKGTKPQPAGKDEEETAAPEATLDPEAIASMRQARDQGDPRTPPIVHSPEGPSATPDELADPQLYEAFEARQEMAVYRRFTYAATAKIDKLEKLLAEGKAQGLPPEKLAEGEEKIARLKEVQEKLLLKYPDILDKPAP
ncbi:hypothetical protein QQM79_02185 [Marinobacteraceae bacterium S3BR75-40.1]